MESLRAYLNSLDVQAQIAFAQRCDTTVGYLRKALSTKQALGAELCLAIERATNGAVTCEELRPDIDWRRPSQSEPQETKVAA